MQKGHVRKKNRVLIILMALLLLFSSFNFNVFNARAESQIYPFDQTNVLDDLESSADFNILNYPYKANEPERIINFVEWAYSPFKPDDFALYIYLYNPKKTAWKTDSFANRVQMAVRYKTNPTQEEYDYVITADSSPVDYETFNIVFCNKSEREGYEGLFYKFRIIDHESADGMTIQERVNSLERRYDISGVVLGKEDGTSEEILIGGTYRFSGYAKGYGPNPNSASTLKNEGFKGLEVLRLEVNATNYRAKNSESGDYYHHYDINSLYFSVPEQYFTKYGNLQKIKLEWYEYKTTPMFMMKTRTAYDKLKNYVGVDLTGKGGSQKAYDSKIGYQFYTRFDDSNILWKIYKNCYNVDLPAKNLGYSPSSDSYVQNAITEMQWLFPTETATANEVKEYIKNYPYAKKGYLPVKNGKISADLFLDTVDNGRTRGYNCVEIDAGDEWDLKNYTDSYTALQKWAIKLYGGNGYTKIGDVSPIICDIRESEITSTNVLVNKDDLPAFKEFYKDAKEKNERTVLFRFAVTDYWYEGLCDKRDLPKQNKGDIGSISQQTVFLDTKIIQLTFQTKDKYTVIPVVQDPLDVINGVTNPPPEKGWLERLLEVIGAWGTLILGIVGTIILVFLIIKIIGAFMPGGIIAKIIMCLLVAGLCVLGYFFIDWIIETIYGLGGLTW